jgi:hypothetical protein
VKHPLIEQAQKYEYFQNFSLGKIWGPTGEQTSAILKMPGFPNGPFLLFSNFWLSCCNRKFHQLHYFISVCLLPVMGPKSNFTLGVFLKNFWPYPFVSQAITSTTSGV